MSEEITGFSKLSKDEKIEWLTKTCFQDSDSAKNVLTQYWNSDSKLQKLHDEFSENTISNYYLPFAIAPNFLINEKIYSVPMTIEESSVVAAASKAAKFWMKHGGFKAEVINEETFKCSIVVPYIAVRRSEHFSPLVTDTGGVAPDKV